MFLWAAATAWVGGRKGRKGEKMEEKQKRDEKEARVSEARGGRERWEEGGRERIGGEIAGGLRGREGEG